jgi:hypothetical protein
MKIRLRDASGAWLLLTCAPAFAQESSAAKASAAASCASCVPGDKIVVVEGGPTWLVAGFFIGLVVGYALAKALAARTTSNNIKG